MYFDTGTITRNTNFDFVDVIVIALSTKNTQMQFSNCKKSDIRLRYLKLMSIHLVLFEIAIDDCK